MFLLIKRFFLIAIKEFVGIGQQGNTWDRYVSQTGDATFLPNLLNPQILLVLFYHHNYVHMTK